MTERMNECMRPLPPWVWLIGLVAICMLTRAKVRDHFYVLWSGTHVGTIKILGSSGLMMSTGTQNPAR